MKKNTNDIILAGAAHYLGEIDGFDDLPSNCRFNKVLTGCGGTSVALSNDQPYVICMPFKSLINNKMEWCNERNITALPVHGDACDRIDVERFTGEKIMVTYDSLDKVVDGLGTRVRDFKILVDEYHLLINSGSFRYDAVNQVLKMYKEFGEFVFMTATPTKQEYLPRSLCSIPEVTVKWDDTAPVTLDYSVLSQRDLYPTVANVAHKYYAGVNPGNAYFFLNSVTGIICIVNFLRRLGATHEDIRIICAQTDFNKAKLIDALGPEYQISTASDFPKKINFLTSTCFEGADIHDCEGVTYIISDGKKSQTKYDIMTTIPQIIGRIRDTQFKNWAKIVFSPSEYFSHTTESEFSEFVKRNLNDAYQTVTEFNQASTNTKELILKGVEGNSYLRIRDGELEVNETAWCAEMQYFSAMHTTYYVKRDKTGRPVQNEGSRNKEINGVPYVFNSVPPKEIWPNRLEGMRLGVQRKSFKELVDLYHGWIDSFKIPPAAIEREMKEIKKYYPLIPMALEKLGHERIVALEYNQKEIKTEITKLQTLSNPAKVMRCLCEYTYRVGRRIPFSTIKTDLQVAYGKLGIDRRAKATDLQYVFGVKKCKIKKSGKRVDGYKIIGKR